MIRCLDVLGKCSKGLPPTCEMWILGPPPDRRLRILQHGVITGSSSVSPHVIATVILPMRRHTLVSKLRVPLYSTAVYTDSRSSCRALTRLSRAQKAVVWLMSIFATFVHLDGRSGAVLAVVRCTWGLQYGERSLARAFCDSLARQQ